MCIYDWFYLCCILWNCSCWSWDLRFYWDLVNIVLFLFVILLVKLVFKIFNDVLSFMFRCKVVFFFVKLCLMNVDFWMLILVLLDWILMYCSIVFCIYWKLMNFVCVFLVVEWYKLFMSWMFDFFFEEGIVLCFI